MLLGACGRGVVFGQHVVLRHPHKIRIGDDVVDRRPLPDRRQGRHATPASPSARGTFIGRNTILSCKNGDIVIGDGANIGFNCEMFSAARVELGPRALLAAYCYVIGGDHDWKDAGRAGARTGTRRLRRAHRRRRLAWRGREGARRHDGRRRRDRRRRGGGECRRAGAGDCRRRAGAASSARARRRPAHEPSAERPAGVRSPRVGRVAHARRQAPVRVDDPAVRSQPLQRLAGQPAKEGSVGRDARRARHRHRVPAPLQVRSRDADRAAEDHRPQGDRHPAPARLRRDDVRAAGRRDAAGCRRSCTSTPISPTRPGSRRSPIGCSSRIPTSPSRSRRAPPSSCASARLVPTEKIKVVYLGAPVEEFSRAANAGRDRGRAPGARHSTRRVRGRHGHAPARLEGQRVSGRRRAAGG